MTGSDRIDELETENERLRIINAHLQRRISEVETELIDAQRREEVALHKRMGRTPSHQPPAPTCTGTHPAV